MPCLFLHQRAVLVVSDYKYWGASAEKIKKKERRLAQEEKTHLGCITSLSGNIIISEFWFINNTSRSFSSMLNLLRKPCLVQAKLRWACLPISERCWKLHADSAQKYFRFLKRKEKLEMQREIKLPQVTWPPAQTKPCYVCVCLSNWSLILFIYQPYPVTQKKRRKENTRRCGLEGKYSKGFCRLSKRGVTQLTLPRPPGLKTGEESGVALLWEKCLSASLLTGSDSSGRRQTNFFHPFAVETVSLRCVAWGVCFWLLLVHPQRRGGGGEQPHIASV